MGKRDNLISKLKNMLHSKNNNDQQTKDENRQQFVDPWNDSGNMP